MLYALTRFLWLHRVLNTVYALHTTSYMTEPFIHCREHEAPPKAERIT